MRLRTFAANVLLAGGLVAPGLAGETPAARPQDVPAAFDVQASAITVDAVVVDREGRPVRGLTRDDFTVLEDGRPQTVVGFEARAMAEVAAETHEPARDVSVGAVANDEAEAPPERVFALLIDDLGLTPQVAGQVKSALASWIAGQARPRDEITLLTTSGDVWWSDRVARGRDDLLRALERVRARAPLRGGSESMSDFEAYRIALYEESTELLLDPSARSRPPEFAGSVAQGAQGPMFFVSKLKESSTVERVTQRWLEAHVCPACVDPSETSLDCVEIRGCRQRVMTFARAQYGDWTRRTKTVHDAVVRLARGLADVPGRKAILLISEELLEDASLNLSARTADACQRANVALYFSGARGLAGSSAFAAATDVAPRSQDMGQIGLEEGVLALAGGVALAEETGGVAVTSSNDLAAGLRRMAQDSSAYYLLGYEPRQTPDGEWHALKVQVKREEVEVRARRRYRASKEEPRPPVAEQANGQANGQANAGRATVGKRALAPALLAGGARGGIPLRVATFVQEPSDNGAVSVTIAVEIDNSRVLVNRNATPWKATLDLTLLTASLYRAPGVPIDERLELTLGPEELASGWWLVSRKVWLAPGVNQIRVQVRDTASGATGLVTERVVVPGPHEAYISTPLITDRTAPSARPDLPPQLVPTAQRTFGRRGTVFCQYEVYLFGGWNLPGVGQLVASHTVRRLDGSVVSASTPTPITTSGQRAVRRIALPVDRLDAGSYEVAVVVEDILTGRTLATNAGFRVDRAP